MPRPCTDWIQKLTARHPDDLTPADRKALNAHLVSCRACNEVYTAYNRLEKGFRGLAIDQPIPRFSNQPLQHGRFFSISTTAPSLHFLCLMILATLSSLYMSISWSRLFQNVHTWILVVSASVPRRIRYVSSDSHFLYAMRSDSGYFLWKQKRFRRCESISSLSIRGNGLSLMGFGVALAIAQDFCKYAVQP
jgi:hypothetical protein